MNCDVLVVGAGPSGSVTARELASRGYDVLVIEKETMPRYKPCGGGVTAKAAALAGIDMERVAERHVGHAIIIVAGQRLSIAGDGIGCMVMRPALDAALADSATAAGARLIEGERLCRLDASNGAVSVRTSRDEYRARVVVAADGVESIAARQLGIEHGVRTGIGLEAELEPVPPPMDDPSAVFDFDAIPSGYGYVFPKKQHVSAGIFTTRPPLAGMRERLDAFCAARGLTSARRLSVVGHRIPLGAFAQRRWHADRGLAVGDAAGLADAFWGEGIYYALKSGAIAANAIDWALRRNASTPPLGAYSERLWNVIGRDLRAAYWCARTLYALPPAAMFSLVADTLVCEQMINVLRGRSTYTRFAIAALARLPRLVAAAAIRPPRLASRL